MNYFGAGIQTTRNGTGYYKPTDSGDSAFDFAWLLHQKRNDHHWQFWLLPKDGGTKILEMSDAARKELLADWRGAGKAQGKPDTTKWYLANQRKMFFGPKTRCWIEHQLGISRS